VRGIRVIAVGRKREVPRQCPLNERARLNKTFWEEIIQEDTVSEEHVTSALLTTCAEDGILHGFRTLKMEAIRSSERPFTFNG
jgi:hypothetical protein